MSSLRNKGMLLLVLVAMTIGLIAPMTVYAATTKDAAEGLLEKQIDFIDSHIEWAIEIGDRIEAKYGSKPPITSVLSQSAYESAWGKSNFCLNHKNDFGIGGKSAPKDFLSHYESWEYYYELIATREDYVKNGSLKSENTYEYINALIDGGYCTDDEYLEDILSIANKIKPYVIAKEAEIRASHDV